MALSEDSYSEGSDSDGAAVEAPAMAEKRSSGGRPAAEDRRSQGKPDRWDLCRAVGQTVNTQGASTMFPISVSYSLL